MVLLKIYLAGMAVLAGAIALNVLAGAWHITTWYGFLDMVKVLGPGAALRALRVVDVLFLVGLYPAALGACAYLVLRA